MWLVSQAVKHAADCNVEREMSVPWTVEMEVTEIKGMVCLYQGLYWGYVSFADCFCIAPDSKIPLPQLPPAICI